MSRDHSAHVETILSSSARTSSSASEIFDVSPWSELTVLIDVTAASGTTPTLDFTLQAASTATATTFHDWPTVGPFGHAAMTQITAAGQAQYIFGGIGQYVRMKYTIGGTSPSFTFSVTYILKN